MERVYVGNVELLALSDMVFTFVPAEKYPEAPAEQLAEFQSWLDSDGKMPMNFGCALIRADGHTILVDTGFGPRANGKLMNEFAAAQTTAADVDVVVFTHLHGDHLGWAYDSEAGTPRFQRAKYVVPRLDWDHFSNREPASNAFKYNMLPLQGSSALELIEDEYTITPSLVTVPAPGHTPGHQAIAISSQGEHAYVVGDAFMSPIDVADPKLVSTWDWNADEVRSTRRMLGGRIEAEHALVAASHLPKPGLGRFRVTDGQRRWQSVSGA